MKCKVPAPPENGVIGNDGPYNAGEMLQITCRPNFMMEGQAYLTCQSNGSWSENMPKCKFIYMLFINTFPFIRLFLEKKRTISQ